MTLGRKVLFFVALSLMVCVPAAMAKSPPKQSAAGDNEIAESLVNQTLSNIEATHKRRNVQEFMVFLDKDYGARLKFADRIQSQFISAKELEIRFVTDTVLTKGNKVSVRLHWLKKTVDNSGLSGKAQGACRFVFKKHLEGLKLLYIRGDNPFF